MLRKAGDTDACGNFNAHSLARIHSYQLDLSRFRDVCGEDSPCFMCNTLLGACGAAVSGSIALPAWLQPLGFSQAKPNFFSALCILAHPFQTLK